MAQNFVRGGMSSSEVMRQAAQYMRENKIGPYAKAKETKEK